MSRSFRYNPEEEAFENAPSWERPDEGYGDDELDFGDVVAKPRKRRRKDKSAKAGLVPMTPEWALELMKDRVLAVVDLLAVRNIIARHECDDYAQIINMHICRILPDYDGERKNAKGRKAGVERYLSVAIDNVAKNIKKHVASRRKNLPTMPIIEVDDEDEDDENKKECEGEAFCDRCRSIKDLWFRMDYETLLRMLTREERLTLAFRIEGFTYPEIAEKVSLRLGVTVDRFHIMNVTMERIRTAARKCGFVPPWETWEKAYEK